MRDSGMNNMDEMGALPGILFPYLQESMVQKILSFFWPLTIFQPWFMERPIFIPENDELNAIQIRNPPTNLKPGDDFMTLLSEYRQWIKYHQDRSYMEFLKASQGMDLSESTTWEIRQMLRQREQRASTHEEEFRSRWHLILHLAQEVEDQRMEADRMLKVLKQKDPPLKGIVEESDHVKGPLEDLPEFESEPVVDEDQLRQIFEAWFGLFGGYLGANELLITCDPRVMDYASELWKDLGDGDNMTHDSSVRFKFPDLSQHTLENLITIRRKYFNDGIMRELKNLILEVGERPEQNLSKLKKLSHEVESFCPWELGEGTLKIWVQHLAPLADDEHIKGHGVLKHLSRRTIILVEAEPHYE
jgi:hypothetical protein